MTAIDQSRASLDAILARTSPPVREAIARIARASRPASSYIVAGAVRDALLDQPFADIDLAVEGDAIDALRKAMPGAKVTAHEKFRTASVKVAGTTIDVVTARRETYLRPGALPRIQPSNIEDDLRRRDFTVNALAVRLDEPGIVLDPTGGLVDLERGLIRVLHTKSFEDDPTRIFRALRYAARLGFTVEPDTQALLLDALALVSTVSGTRLRRELELMLRERGAGGGLEAAHRARVLGAVHPSLYWDVARTEALSDPSFAAAPRIPFGFALMAARASPEEAAKIVDRLRLRREEAAAVSAIASIREVARTLRRPGAKPSGVVVLLERYPTAAVAALAANTDDPIARQLAVRYLAEWRHEKPLLRGDDLVALGVPSGPQIQKGLQLIRAARLDGWATDEGDERALALRFAKSIRDSSAAHAEIELHANGH